MSEYSAIRKTITKIDMDDYYDHIKYQKGPNRADKLEEIENESFVACGYCLDRIPFSPSGSTVNLGAVSYDRSINID
jgi:coenzyme F420-reducing hydrogenase beta subunit